MGIKNLSRLTALNSKHLLGVSIIESYIHNRNLRKRKDSFMPQDNPGPSLGNIETEFDTKVPIPTLIDEPRGSVGKRLSGFAGPHRFSELPDVEDADVGKMGIIWNEQPDNGWSKPRIDLSPLDDDSVEPPKSDLLIKVNENNNERGVNTIKSMEDFMSLYESNSSGSPGKQDSTEKFSNSQKDWKKRDSKPLNNFSGGKMGNLSLIQEIDEDKSCISSPRNGNSSNLDSSGLPTNIKPERVAS